MQEHSLNIHETNRLPIVDFPRGEELIQKSYLNLSIFLTMTYFLLTMELYYLCVHTSPLFRWDISVM